MVMRLKGIVIISLLAIPTADAGHFNRGHSSLVNACHLVPNADAALTVAALSVRAGWSSQECFRVRPQATCERDKL